MDGWGWKDGEGGGRGSDWWMLQKDADVENGFILSDTNWTQNIMGHEPLSPGTHPPPSVMGRPSHSLYLLTKSFTRVVLNDTRKPNRHRAGHSSMTPATASHTSGFLHVTNHSALVIPAQTFHCLCPQNKDAPHRRTFFHFIAACRLNLMRAAT